MYYTHSVWEYTEDDSDDVVLHLAQLRSSLPQMIVDILEEKMEQEYRVGAVSLLQHSNDAPVLGRADDDDDDDNEVNNNCTVKSIAVSSLLLCECFGHIRFQCWRCATFSAMLYIG